jgi:hypothetical protein
MCRSAAHGGRRCTGHGYSNSRANQAARQRLSRTTRALAAAEAAGDTDAAGAARQRVADALAAVVATRVPATACAPKPRSMVPDEQPVEVRGAGGSTADTKILTYADGTKLIHKHHGARTEALEIADTVAITDAEELGPKVLSAFGLRAAKVERTGDVDVHMEFVDGQLGHEMAQGFFRKTSPDVLDSEQGRLIGLADHVMANQDRNAGNWICTPDGDLVGIDHGNAFFDDARLSSSEFATAGLYTNPDPEHHDWKLAPSNDFTPADMAEARRRLEDLRPEFERTGRTDWHDGMLRRLADVEQHAAGTRNRITPAHAGDVTPQTDNAKSWPSTDQDAATDQRPATDSDRAKPTARRHDSTEDVPVNADTPTPEQPEDKHTPTGPKPPAERARRRRRDRPGITNVNYAAPGAHVGVQTAVSYGDTVITDNGTHHTTGPRPPADEFEQRIQEKVRRATERARAATRRAKQRDDADDADEDGSTTVHNVARGGEHVAMQVGINYGTTRHYRR